MPDVLDPPEKSISGRVEAVNFVPGGGNYGLKIFIRGREESVQIDGAKFTVDGKTVTRKELLTWFAGLDDKQVSSVKLSGIFGRFPECEKADFTTEIITNKEKK